MTKIIQLPFTTKKAAVSKAVHDCMDPEKTCVGTVHFAGISEDPIHAFASNKYLNEPEQRKLLSKTIIVRMDTPWPKEVADRITYAIKLQRVLDCAIWFWAALGFQSVGAVHSDTVHPNLWLVIDTCQVGYGLQMSMNPMYIDSFTCHLGDKMTALKLGETLPCTQMIPTISEAKLRAMMQKDFSNTKISLPICAEALAPRTADIRLHGHNLKWYQEVYSPTAKSHREMRLCNELR